MGWPARTVNGSQPYWAVVGGNWLQLSAVHRVSHGVAKWSDSIPSRSLLPCTNLPLYHHQSTLRPSHCLHHAWQMRLTNVLLCDPNTSNLDLSVHYTFFQSFSVQCLYSFAHLSILFLLASLRYGFFFATRPRRSASWSRLFTVDVETGVLRVLFNEAASWGLVRRLKVDTLMYLSSCSVVHRASHSSFYSG